MSDTSRTAAANGTADIDAARAARKALRLRLIEARTNMSTARRQAADTQLERHLRALLAQLAPASLGFCWPYRGEFDARAVVRDWLAADPLRWAALPVVGATGTPMRFRRWRLDAEMPLDRYGIPFPGEGPDLTPALLLVPCNGFDARGYRIGYGAGHFDRTLAAMRPTPIAVGIAYELGRIDNVQPHALDLPMDWVVTECGRFCSTDSAK